MVGSEKLVRYSLLAGERALAAYANEEAVEHFERALAAKKDQPPSTGSGQAMDAETAALLFGLGRALAATVPWDEMHHAVASLSRAFDYYVESGDVARAVAITEYPKFVAPLLSGMDELGRLVDRALDLVPAGSREAGVILARQVRVLGVLRNDYEGAQEALGRAMAIARRDNDGALEARILSNAINVATAHLHFPEALEMCMRGIELGQSLDDPYAEGNGHFWAAAILAAWGEPDRAIRHAEACLSLAEKLRDRLWLGLALFVNQLPAQVVGDWKVARDLSDRGLPAYSNFHLLAGRALLDYQVGDFGQGEEYLERLLEIARPVDPVSRWVAVTIAVTGRISGAAGRSDVARAFAKTVASSPDAVPWFVVGARLGLALLAVQAGDATEAEEQYAALGSHHGMMWLEGTICIDRVLGLLAHTMGKLDEAAAHFEEALAFCRKAGYRPELAWSLCDYADALLQPSTAAHGEPLALERSEGFVEPGDRQKAMSLLDESLAISRELGMGPLMERALSRKMGLQGIDVSAPQTSIDAVVSAVEVERPNLQRHAAPDGTVTVMFTDIEGFTAMTERLGDQKAQDILHIHNAIIREQVAAHQGFEVKSQGDGFMLAYSSARRALECAIAIQQALTAHNAGSPGEPLRVRIGLHTGETIKEGEDFFGKSVILAARIAAQAHGDQIVVSSLLKALVENSGEFKFGEAQEVEFKGLTGAHHLHQVAWPGSL